MSVKIAALVTVVSAAALGVAGPASASVPASDSETLGAQQDTCVVKYNNTEVRHQPDFREPVSGYTKKGKRLYHIVGTNGFVGGVLEGAPDRYTRWIWHDLVNCP